MKTTVGRPIKRYLNLAKYKASNAVFRTSTIILYHRISDVTDDPHLLSVSPENFRAHLEYLSKERNIVSLAQIFENLAEGRLDSRDVAITFDDGYADNLHTALPILEEFGAKATIFVTTGTIGSTQPFYWDNDTKKADIGRPMTMDELKTIAKSPLIEIGAHTINHPNLAKQDISDQKKEVSESKKFLESSLAENGQTVRFFAYPFGSPDSFTDETMTAVKEAGFAGAVSTAPTRVYPFSDKFKVPRIIIRNWNTDRFVQELKTH